MQVLERPNTKTEKILTKKQKNTCLLFDHYGQEIAMSNITELTETEKIIFNIN